MAAFAHNEKKLFEHVPKREYECVFLNAATRRILYDGVTVRDQVFKDLQTQGDSRVLRGSLTVNPVSEERVSQRKFLLANLSVSSSPANGPSDHFSVCEAHPLGPMDVYAPHRPRLNLCHRDSRLLRAPQCRAGAVAPEAQPQARG